jgi:hypothetical protein
MGKIVFWLVIVFAVLFVLRLVNASKAQKAAQARGPRGKGEARPEATAMVRCVGCGVFLPRGEALPAPDGFHCGRHECAPQAPPR